MNFGCKIFLSICALKYLSTLNKKQQNYFQCFTILQSLINSYIVINLKKKKTLQ